MIKKNFNFIWKFYNTIKFNKLELFNQLINRTIENWILLFKQQMPGIMVESLLIAEKI